LYTSFNNQLVQIATKKRDAPAGRVTFTVHFYDSHAAHALIKALSDVRRYGGYDKRGDELIVYINYGTAGDWERPAIIQTFESDIIGRIRTESTSLLRQYADAKRAQAASGHHPSTPTLRVVEGSVKGLTPRHRNRPGGQHNRK
jgi:hypothetical protein